MWVAINIGLEVVNVVVSLKVGEDRVIGGYDLVEFLLDFFEYYWTSAK